jgi:hypothetical protein
MSSFASPLTQSVVDDPLIVLTQGLGSTNNAASFDTIFSNGLASNIQSETYPAPKTAFQLLDAQGGTTNVTSQTGSIPLGAQTLVLSDNQQAVVTPGTLSTLNTATIGVKGYNGEDQVITTYSGSDMRVMIEVPDPTGSGDSHVKQLLELTTVTVSIHRVKTPVRACGYINAKGHARGSRTIAGTMVLTPFTVDILYRFLYNQTADISKDSFYVKPDQLPPFDLTILFADELGNCSSRRLLGVDCVTDGTVYSTNDMFVEQTISYMATDFTPLVPVTRSTLLQRSLTDAVSIEKTPMSMLLRSSDLTLA